MRLFRSYKHQKITQKHFSKNIFRRKNKVFRSTIIVRSM